MGPVSQAAAIQPFANLDTETEDALRASIKRRGVVVPIVVDQNGRIIDGHHRARIARELNVTCPQVSRRVRDDEDANELAYSLNADRRQMSAEQRRQVVADLREQGYSLRAIAGVVGVSHQQVTRDLNKAEQQVSPPVTPEEKEDGEVGNYTFAPAAVDAETGEITDEATGRVLGQDGKSYPKKRPPANPEKTREGIAAKWAKVAELAAGGLTSRQIAEVVGMDGKTLRRHAKEKGIEFPADETGLVNGLRAIDPNRVVGETVTTVEGAAFALSVVPIDISQLDRESLAGWVSSLSESLRSLTTLKNNLKKELTRD